MAYTINNDECIGCGTCSHMCPTGAIGFGFPEDLKIDYELCTECGTCYNSCPVEAIEVKQDEN